MQSMDFSFPLSPGFVELQFDQFDTQGGLRELKSVELMITGTVGAVGSNFTLPEELGCNGNFPDLVLRGGKTE